ncbi:TPA: head decoration protein [Providencia alcalifaciens]|uniref:head decoration protein n=1 Tax=Providencia alcalifaciens TaxID=126385 RepID=UPI0015D00BD0|nr:head decoration protein [Providencia alcalifaciens]MBF0693346.1 head decoration protein [Providencia alcalifaciens]NYS91850.1 head decoration protein [Providencia alcalifaciens]
MVIRTEKERRQAQRIFAGSDPAYSAMGVSGITTATVELTPLMVDRTTGKLKVWDGWNAGTAVGVLALPVDGTESTLTYWKSGTFATEALNWPNNVDAVKKANAFAGSAISHVALP